MYQNKTFKLTLMSVDNDPVSFKTKTGANIYHYCCLKAL